MYVHVRHILQELRLTRRAQFSALGALVVAEAGCVLGECEDAILGRPVGQPRAKQPL